MSQVMSVAALRLPERGNRLRCLEMQELTAGKDLSLLDCTVRPRIGGQPLHGYGRGFYVDALLRQAKNQNVDCGARCLS